MNTAAFEREVSEAFEGGAILQRELRLDPGQAERLRADGARVTELCPSGDKFWYEISFARADQNQTACHA